MAYFLRKTQNLRVNNSRIPRTKKTKFSEYHFYLNTIINEDFQICISVPLNSVNFCIVLIFCIFGNCGVRLDIYFSWYFVIVWFRRLGLFSFFNTVSLLCWNHYHSILVSLSSCVFCNLNDALFLLSSCVNFEN